MVFGKKSGAEKSYLLRPHNYCFQTAEGDYSAIACQQSIVISRKIPGTLKYLNTLTLTLLLSHYIFMQVVTYFFVQFIAYRYHRQAQYIFN